MGTIYPIKKYRLITEVPEVKMDVKEEVNSLCSRKLNRTIPTSNSQWSTVETLISRVGAEKGNTIVYIIMCSKGS